MFLLQDNNKLVLKQKVLYYAKNMFIIISSYKWYNTKCIYNKYN